MRGRSEYFFRAANHERSRQLQMFKSNWREIKDALETHETPDSKSFQKADQIYMSFSSDLGLDSFRNVLSLLDWVNVLEAKNPETNSPNQYDMESYEPEALEEFGEVAERREVEDTRPEYNSLSYKLQQRDTLPDGSEVLEE